MPSFLTLIFQSPESFQRQRRPKQRGHLPLRSKPRSGSLRSWVIRTCLCTGLFSLWDFMDFPAMRGKASPTPIPSNNTVHFPSSSPPLLCTRSSQSGPASCIWDSPPAVEKESTPGLSFIHVHEAAMRGNGERMDGKGRSRKKLWWARHWQISL